MRYSVIIAALCFQCSAPIRPMDAHTREKIITALRAIADTMERTPMPTMDASAPIDASVELPRSI